MCVIRTESPNMYLYADTLKCRKLEHIILLADKFFPFLFSTRILSLFFLTGLRCSQEEG